MIYGRCGQQVKILRLAVIADIKRIDKRKPDEQDKDAIAYGSYVVVDDGGQERLYHLAFLRADGGSREITDAIESIAKNS